MTREIFLAKLEALVDEAGYPTMCVDVSFCKDDTDFWRYTRTGFDRVSWEEEHERLHENCEV